MKRSRKRALQLLEGIHLCQLNLKHIPVSLIGKCLMIQLERFSASDPAIIQAASYRDIDDLLFGVVELAQRKLKVDKK